MASRTEPGSVFGTQRVVLEKRRAGASPIDDHVATRKFLILADLGLLWTSSAVCVALYLGFRGRILSDASNDVSIAGHVALLLLYSVLVVLFGHSRGLYTRTWIQRSVLNPWELLKAIASATLILAAFIFISGSRTVSLEVVATVVFFSTGLLLAWRYWIRSESIEGLGEQRNVLIVGMGRVGQALRCYLEENEQLGYVFKGFLDRRSGARVDDEGPGGRALGAIDQLDGIVRTHFIDEILITDRDHDLVAEIATRSHAAGIDVRIVPDLHDGLAFGAPVEMLGRFPTMSLHRQPVPAMELFFKRLFDIVFATLALVVSSPLCALIALAIRLESKGPVIYSSERVGKKGRLFRSHKFRTMVLNADELKDSIQHLNERDRVLFKIANDPRMTRIGKFLRKFSLDELPQFWNVLKAEMSVVGPRPPIPNEREQYASAQLRRLDVMPGITGLWQVEARQNPSFDTYIDLDLKYVENWSVWLDLQLIVRTIKVVFAGSGQ